MAEQESKAYKVVEKVKTTELVIHDVESDAVIVNVQGWRMRVYFDKDYSGHLAKGLSIEVDYYGDIDDPHSIRFEKLK